MNPREFWLRFQDGSNLALVASAGETRDWEGIHVIEYSAFDAAITEASEQDKLVYIRTKERDEARADLAEFKTDCAHIHHCDEEELKVALKERDQAVQAMNDAHDSLRKSGEQDAALRRERDEAREALVFYKSEKDGNPGRWQYWRASRAKILDDFNAERSRSAKLVDAIEQSIGRADDHGDSWCSRPIRDALAEYSKGESK